VSQEVKEVINTVTKTTELSQLPTVFGRQRVMVTVGIMLGLLLAALEVTIIATAMPKVVASLGGFSSYSWVFSIYLLTSTIGMPIWGKMSDLYGRRICYQVGITIFLVGSVLCGMATSMNQLILYRAIQGLGGGALIPLALTVIGDIYLLQERPKMQAVISGIWGFSSVVGPLVGGFLTDYSSWRWIFFLNLPLGIIAFIIITLNMKEPKKQQIKPKVDIAGAITLTLTIGLLLIGCLKSESKVPSWISTTAIISSIGMLMLFIRIEKRASEPILPLWLFREKIFLATVLGNLFAGCMLFGSMPFVTLFAQAVLNSSATRAGTVLMPLILGWVSLSVIGVKLMLKSGFRKSIIIGQVGMVLGFSLLIFMTLHLSKTFLYISMAIVGMGMGLALTALIIAVQSSVPKNQLGIVTSSAIFFRNIGGSIGATIMGALLSTSIARALLAIPPEITSSGYKEQLTQLLGNINIALDPLTRANLSDIVLSHFRTVIAGGIQIIFIFCLLVAIAAFASSLLVPPDKKEPSTVKN
jgi:EmrB/QacA subfamily drug resistance transporter